MLCLLIVWGMTFIFMVHLSFYAIPLLIYDVIYITTTIRIGYSMFCVGYGIYTRERSS